MLRNICEFIKCLWKNRSKWQELKQCLLENREPSLILAGVLGIGFAFAIYCGTGLFGLENNALQSSLTLLSLGLPTFFILWVFRTYDVQSQLDKTQENTNNNTFFECARMLTEETSSDERKNSPQRPALIQLAYLKNETNFDEAKINMLTRQLNLEGLNFSRAYLKDLDFSRSNLQKTDFSSGILIGAILQNADLREANLQDANLRRADLTEAYLHTNAKLYNADLMNANLTKASLVGTNLQEADLRGANLQMTNLDSADLRGAKLKNTNLGDSESLRDAKYNKKTQFPDGFDPEEAGMSYPPDPSPQKLSPE